MYKNAHSDAARHNTQSDTRPQPSEARGIVLWNTSRISDHASGAKGKVIGRHSTALRDAVHDAPDDTHVRRT